MREIHQTEVVRQRGAHVHSAELHHFGDGEAEHTAGQQRTNVSGHGQLRFHRRVRARDVCQSKLPITFNGCRESDYRRRPFYPYTAHIPSRMQNNANEIIKNTFLFSDFS